MASEPSLKSHLYEAASETDFFCKGCKSMKFRCEGCSRVVCRCSKNNGHMAGDHYYVCLGKDGGVTIEFSVPRRVEKKIPVFAGWIAPKSYSIERVFARPPIVIERGALGNFACAASIALDMSALMRQKSIFAVEQEYLISRCDDEQLCRFQQLREDWFNIPSEEYVKSETFVPGNAGCAYMMPWILIPLSDRALSVMQRAVALVRELSGP